jgi:hypothetical protein
MLLRRMQRRYRGRKERTTKQKSVLLINLTIFNCMYLLAGYCCFIVYFRFLKVKMLNLFEVLIECVFILCRALYKAR